MQKPIMSSRRTLLNRMACGFGSLALSGIAGSDSLAAVSRFGVHLNSAVTAPRAKRIIFIFMQGGPSQVDTFDPKPALKKYHDQKVEFLVARTRKRSKESVFQSPWKFQKQGQSGRDVSALFPHMAKCVDDFCLIRSMHTEGVAHGPATLFLHTGATNLIRPSMGSWVTYGLGSENLDLPSFVTINPPPTKGGPRNYGNAFLPASHQGVVIGKQGNQIKNLSNPSI